MGKLLNYFKLKSYRLVNKIFGTTFSFSADGEDVIIRKFLSGIQKGFYVDLGAHNHKIGSNTYYFYLLGWSGICIDPLPSVKDKFKEKRTKDTVINKAITSNKENNRHIKYHFFKDFEDNSTTSEKRIHDLKKILDEHQHQLCRLKQSQYLSL